VGKVYDNGNIDESCNDGVYDFLVVQHQSPNLPVEQLAFLIFHSLAVFEFLFGQMLWLPLIQDNWVIVKH
jgi:hypothetical protein